MHDSTLAAAHKPTLLESQLAASPVTACVHSFHIEYTALSPVYGYVVQAFQTMAKRESIKRAVERKTADFQRLFIDDLNMVKKQFDLLKRVPAADPVLPRYAGQAIAALLLAKRADHTWQALQVSLHVTHLAHNMHCKGPSLYMAHLFTAEATVALCPAIHFTSLYHVPQPFEAAGPKLLHLPS